MLVYNRNYCILCNDTTKLNDITTLKIPLYAVCPKDVNNYSWDMTYGYCEFCFSVQLKTLLDPNILYDKNYVQPLAQSYNWIQHNISFIQFIVSCIDTKYPLIEIGSSSFVLGKHLIEYYKDYTVFDYCLDQAVRRPNVKYIEGNCEEYNFSPTTNIIMSHVFEHLYEPKKFIENCKKSSVQNIIIAIPSMNDLKDLNVFNQHTFLFNAQDIEYIFGLSHFKLIKQTHFYSNDNSFPALFFHFQLTPDPICIQRDIVINRHLPTQKILSPMHIPTNTFIATSGMQAISIYAIIINKIDVIGVIDYNTLIHGYKFADTELTIQPYEFLEGRDSSYSILVFGYRKVDIISCIRKINTQINIIEL